MLTARAAALDPVHESTVREDPGWINPVIGAQAEELQSSRRSIPEGLVLLPSR